MLQGEGEAREGVDVDERWRRGASLRLADWAPRAEGEEEDSGGVQGHRRVRASTAAAAVDVAERAPKDRRSRKACWTLSRGAILLRSRP